LKDIRRRLPADIHEPDRTWLALAAYNIGMGHLEDARILTEHLGGDPHLWQDVMEHLPLLQKPQYYQSLRYGFARGVEAVTYVQNIRHYHSILEWQEIPDINLPPPADASSHLPHSMRGVRLLAL
jgi:membrane-bound lytic murein transglycosylase F